ncbi:MAG: 1-acyl-sn-glycerol-3-phosphate acyltransferase [Bacteroidales bacterium]|nr:1-acyl-sn-glycerol-3-phosphate acyltransferase [Bacteroidales bacterium]
MNNVQVLQLDVEKAIKSKAPKAGEKIPKFIYNFLSWLICQEKMNFLLNHNGDKYGVDFAEGILKDMNVQVEMVGEENIPKDGKFIFASNHPLGGLDGMALVKLFGHKFDKKVRFVVNDILMNITNLATVFVPINKHGSQGKETALLLNEAFESENQILIFPAGLCSRLVNGKIKDLEWKKAVISRSIEYKRDVIPVYFDGKNSTFFYLFAYIRKILGIKFNIEMLFLPSEMFKNNNKTFKVYIGKPISYTTFDKSRSAKEWAEFLKNKVYQLQQR